MPKKTPKAFRVVMGSFRKRAAISITTKGDMAEISET